MGLLKETVARTVQEAPEQPRACLSWPVITGFGARTASYRLLCERLLQPAFDPNLALVMTPSGSDCLTRSDRARRACPRPCSPADENGGQVRNEESGAMRLTSAMPKTVGGIRLAYSRRFSGT